MVVQSDDRVGIDDVLQHVFEVGVTAGQVRSDLAAGAEELVAGSARSAEELATAFDVGAQDGVGAEELLVVRDGLGLVVLDRLLLGLLDALVEVILGVLFVLLFLRHESVQLFLQKLDATGLVSVGLPRHP